MSSLDAFDSYIAMMRDSLTKEIIEEIKIHRKYLLELRNEDEQQRFFEEFLRWINSVKREKD